jgi:hypothetical protein
MCGSSGLDDLRRRHGNLDLDLDWRNRTADVIRVGNRQRDAIGASASGELAFCRECAIVFRASVDVFRSRPSNLSRRAVLNSAASKSLFGDFFGLFLFPFYTRLACSALAHAIGSAGKSRPSKLGALPQTDVAFTRCGGIG